MLLSKQLASIVFVPLLALNVNIAQPQDIQPQIVPEKTQEQQILDTIIEASNTYKVDKDILYSVLKCESGLDPDTNGDYKNGEYLATNIAQYHKGTFIRHNKKFFEDYKQQLDYSSWSDHIKLTAFALSKGYGNEWTTYRAIKNGGQYSFYSKLLEKNFTVVCKLQNMI